MPMPSREVDERTLWMGDLAEYMDATYIGEAFLKMGEDVNSVKVIFDKYTGQFARYCFVEFPNVDGARRAMLTINGKIIPDSKPPIPFKLSFAYNPSNPTMEYNVIASNLPNEVDDAHLYSIFGKKYFSCRGARVFRNPDGSSKGVGLVRFTAKQDQERSLTEMSKFLIFGRPMQIRPANPRNRNPITGRMMPDYNPAAHYVQNKDYYNSNQWQMYDYYNTGGPPGHGPPMMPPGAPPNQAPHHAAPAISAAEALAAQPLPTNVEEMFGPLVEDDCELEEYDRDCDVQLENMVEIRRSEALFKQLEASNWFFINSANFDEKDLLKRTQKSA